MAGVVAGAAVAVVAAEASGGLPFEEKAYRSATAEICRGRGTVGPWARPRSRARWRWYQRRRTPEGTVGAVASADAVAAAVAAEA